MSNKTSDKDVANIERLNKFANMTFLYGNRVSLNMDNLKEVQQDLKCLLAEREQMLKEREKYHIHLTDEQYRKVIENTQMDTSNDRVIAHKFAVMQQQINEKDKRIQELEEENRIFALEGSKVRLYLYIKENYIPKQAVIDKIKDLKLSGGSNGKDNVENLVRELAIDILQELLEGERK